MSDDKPLLAFWDDEEGSESDGHMFRFRRMWFLTVVVMAVVALAPLSVVSYFDIRDARRSNEAALRFRTERLVSDARRSIGFFLAERQRAAKLILQTTPRAELAHPEGLARLLAEMNESIGGFVGLGLVNADGVQVNYAGPHDPGGVDYSGEDWFEAPPGGIYVSGVVPGPDNRPQVVAAVRSDPEEGRPYYLRAALDAAALDDMAPDLQLEGGGEALIINREGVIQAPGRRRGETLKETGLPMPEYSENVRVTETGGDGAGPFLVGYAGIPDSPFILMVARDKEDLMNAWLQTRNRILGFSAVSAAAILIAILGFTTYLINRIHQADEKRLTALHQAEHESKMASIGRLAAGVAHEINNPLAIINEKAGLIKDAFRLKEKYSDDPRLLEQVDSIVASVHRCGAITRRLLGFSRSLDSHTERIELEGLFGEVLSFLEKSAEHRAVEVHLDIEGDVPPFVSDRGKLQQIFLNLINNAFSAMDKGGTLTIKGELTDEDGIMVTFSDEGEGIPEDVQARIFEPFVSTKKKSGGTGLGLYITRNLVEELGGTITLDSKVGEGTDFRVVLPRTPPKEEE